ncbi:MAG: DUF2203 domain-containing protein [Nitrospirota bacterium]
MTDRHRRQPRHGRKRIFALDEAQTLLPKVQELTERSVAAATIVEFQLAALKGAVKRRAELEQEYFSIINQWAEAIHGLGCEAKGLWLVDFDNGEGYYCWKYPEASLDYFHDYSSGYSGRMKINEI